ncbi:MAG: DUF4932 domain-containing protein [Planctomycetota bacterium]
MKESGCRPTRSSGPGPRGRAPILTAIVFTALITAAAGATPGSRIEVVVDPTVELMSIIFRLAGNSEYNQPNSASPYADEVEAHFGPYREHAVVKTARRLRRQRGVSFDAVMSMAVHLEDTVTLGEKVPFDPRPPRLDKRWRPEEARQFLVEARDFVGESDFNGFVTEHREFYDAAAARLRERIEKRAFIAWFDEFFGKRPDARFRAMVGLLNGGGNYGVGVRFPDGGEEITPVIGVYLFDNDGLPVFGQGIDSTIVHELCHSYTNPFVDAAADELEPWGMAIYPHRAEALERQAYGNWKTMMYESLVRACTVRYALAQDGPAAAQKAVDYNKARGFTWTGKLAGLLGEYERDREKYPTLDTFMPQVVKLFEQVAGRIEQEDEKAAAESPKVLWMSPANGAADVDPGLTEITVVFDRPMASGSWSVVGGGSDFPKTTGSPSYDDDRRVFTMPVTLKPGWTYRFMLNSDRFKAFRSAEGAPLEPVDVSFTTRAE